MSNGGGNWTCLCFVYLLLASRQTLMAESPQHLTSARRKWASKSNLHAETESGERRLQTMAGRASDSPAHSATWSRRAEKEDYGCKVPAHPLSLVSSEHGAGMGGYPVSPISVGQRTCRTDKVRKVIRRYFTT